MSCFPLLKLPYLCQKRVLANMDYKTVLYSTFKFEKFKALASICKPVSDDLEWKFGQESNVFNGLVIGNINFFDGDINGVSNYKNIQNWKINGIRTKVHIFQPVIVFLFSKNDEKEKMLENFRSHIQQVSTVKVCNLTAKDISISRIASCFVWKVNHINRAFIRQNDRDSQVTHEDLRLLMEEISVDNLRIAFKKDENQKEYKVKPKHRKIGFFNGDCICFESFYDMESEDVDIHRTKVSNMDMVDWIKSWMKGGLMNLKKFEVSNAKGDFDIDKIKMYLGEENFEHLPEENAIRLKTTYGETGKLKINGPFNIVFNRI